VRHVYEKKKVRSGVNIINGSCPCLAKKKKKKKKRKLSCSYLNVNLLSYYRLESYQSYAQVYLT
jgi:hypothetical protein